MENQNIGIKVGGLEKENIPIVMDAILKILEAKADQETIRTALDVFTNMARTENVTINNCSISMGENKKIEKEEIQ